MKKSPAEVKEYSEKIDLVGWVLTVVEEWAWYGSVLGGLVGVVQSLVH